MYANRGHVVYVRVPQEIKPMSKSMSKSMSRDFRIHVIYFKETNNKDIT